MMTFSCLEVGKLSWMAPLEPYNQTFVPFLQVFCFVCSNTEHFTVFHFFYDFSLYPLSYDLNNFISDLMTCVFCIATCIQPFINKIIILPISSKMVKKFSSSLESSDS
ncbi:hypothetical protein ILYODFUR_023131 [Ilyodon furcidens]|uniref:Uncharacterized protein n=1 Tax=Ilyodon furcidens TaxID=33524 RepID=A0ABV0TNT9_9TELE